MSFNKKKKKKCWRFRYMTIAQKYNICINRILLRQQIYVQKRRLYYRDN